MTCARNAQVVMQRRLPPLNALRAFEAAGRLSSFSRAGEELNVSHTSISRHVRGLEAKIGVQLFDNLSRGVGLTDAGAAYLKSVSAALDQISDATERLSPQKIGLLQMSCEPTFALKWLMPAIGEFNNNHPDIEIRIDPSHDVVDLNKQHFDFAIRFSRRPIADLEFDVISSAPVCPVGSARLMNGMIDLDDPTTLLSIPMLAENHADLWTEWFEKTGLPLSKLKKKGGGLRTMLAIEAAAAGQGLALVSRELVHNDLKSGRLVKFSNVGLDYGAYCLVYTKAAKRKKSFAQFREWLLEASRDLRP